MFISNYNCLAFKLLNSYDFLTAPQIVIISGLNGLGKTTLLKKLADKMQNKVEKTIMIDAVKFSTRYAFAAQTGQLSSFRKYIRSCDLLLIDNINSLRGKKRSIEELFHTLESIFAKGGKAVITYRGYQPTYDFLGDRFASRLKCGLGISLAEPTDEEVGKFIQYYLAKYHPGLDINQGNVQRLSTKNLHVIIENIERTLEKSFSNQQDSPQTSYARKNMEYAVNLLLKLISEYFEVEESKLLGNSRKSTAVKGRYLLYLILHELYEYSFQEIAQYFQKDSSNMRKQSLIAKEKNLEAFESLCQKLYNQVTADKS